jgi:hypothetical protein
VATVSYVHLYKDIILLTSSNKSSSDKVPTDIDDNERSESCEGSSSMLHGLLNLDNWNTFIPIYLYVLNKNIIAIATKSK